MRKKSKSFCKTTTSDCHYSIWNGHRLSRCTTDSTLGSALQETGRAGCDGEPAIIGQYYSACSHELFNATIFLFHHFMLVCVSIRPFQKVNVGYPLPK